MSRRTRKARRKRRTYIAVSITVLGAFLLAFSLLAWQGKLGSIGSPELKAAIVDQLSDSSPNRTFIENAKSILGKAGFKVYEYTKVAVDVSFYRDLPKGQFDVIVLRVHLATNENSSDVVLFTSEPFSNRKAVDYSLDFLADPPRLVRASIYEGGEAFFGVTPSFIETMNGRFDNTLIIMMGCSGLEPGYTSMAEAMINKGAKVCIGLDGLVSSYYTDHATTILLQKLLAEKKTVQSAVTEVNSEVGPDPDYQSKLSWYPFERGDYSVPT